MIGRPGNRSGASLSSCALFTVDSSVPRGIYQLVVQSDGRQPHRSAPFLASGPIQREVELQPQSLRTPARVIMIEDQGMSPAWTDIPPGATLRVVNISTHSLVLGVDDV